MAYRVSWPIGLALALSPATIAALPAQVAPPPALDPYSARLLIVPKPATASGSVTIRGITVRYRSEASETLMSGPSRDLDITISSIAYLAGNRGAANRRPVTFLFNGGPGSATIALREGLAPRMTVNAPMSSKGKGFAFADNPDSILDATDLVFVDPPGTGYGRFTSDGAKIRAWSVEGDARLLSDFIVTWLRSHGRMASPKYLVGESYAGVRVGFIVDMLAHRVGSPIRFDGVVLVSPSTFASPQDIRKSPDDAAVHSLPTLAAVAAFHGRGAFARESVEAVTTSASAFANGPYADALRAYATLTPAAERDAVARLAEFTGLSLDTIRRHSLRIPIGDFVNELLADKGERTGLLDGRAHALRSVTDTRRPPYNDPSTSPYMLTYDLTDAVETLYRTELGYAPVNGFVRLSGEANQRWNWSVPEGKADIPLLFKSLMTTDRSMRLLIVGGYYDLTIPYAAPLAAYRAVGLPADRFAAKLYRSGHSVFSEPSIRRQATDDLRVFYRAKRGAEPSR